MENLNGITLLLADDDSLNIFAMRAVLEQEGCKLIIASNGREAVDLLDSNPHTDLVLMDIMMPEMDGYEAMRIIRSKAAYRQLPILALTAKAMKGDAALCIEAGASDYMSKPLDVKQLLGKIRQLLASRNSRSDVAS